MVHYCYTHIMHFWSIQTLSAGGRRSSHDVRRSALYFCVVMHGEGSVFLVTAWGKALSHALHQVLPSKLQLLSSSVSTVPSGHESKRLCADGLGSNKICQLISTTWVRVDAFWLVVNHPRWEIDSCWILIPFSNNRKPPTRYLGYMRLLYIWSKTILISGEILYFTLYG